MADAARKFGIGLIGTGMVAPTHARALADLSDRVEVRGVFARDAVRRAAFAGEFAIPEAPSLEALRDDAGLDAVIVLTPANARAEITAMFAGAGKHILMEKPVERTSKAAEAIVGTCARAGVTLGIVFQHRFRECSLKLKEMLDEGALGAISTVQLTVPWWRPQSYYDVPGRGTLARDGGGVLISQAIHSLDLMQSLAGPVAEVQAIAGTSRLHRMETEDFVAGGLVFASGALGSVMATTASYPGKPEVLVFDCEKATATLASGVLAIEWQDGRAETHGDASGTGGGADPMAFPHAWHQGVIADFVDAVTTGRPPAIPGEEALRDHYLIDALLASAKEKRAVRVKGT
jgi:predicted dehydrogenase